MFFQLFGGQQAELQVLGATANRVTHLLWIGGRQHEDDVGRRLFERFQQCGLGPGAQHVHFVEDEHAMAARVAHRRALDEFADVVDAVVARCVEFEHVETRAALDGDT